MQDQTLTDHLAVEAIRNALARYCRGIDRMDRDMVLGVWHPEGTADYVGNYTGSASGFVDWVWQAHSQLERHSHQVTNVLAEVEGDCARSEAYVTAALWTRPDDSGAQQEILIRARYLDRWSQREGRWAIEERTCLVDMHSVHPLTGQSACEASRRDTGDPSYTWLGMG